MKGRQGIAGHHLQRFPSFLQSIIQLPHGLVVERVGQQTQDPSQLGVLRKGGASNQSRRFIGREKMEIVFEHHEVILGKPPVGRIHVQHVDFAAAGRLVLERLLHGLHALKCEAVPRLQTG